MKLIYLVCSLALAAACATGPTTTHQASWLDPLNAGWNKQSPGKTYSIQRVSNPSHAGADSLRFELRSGETWSDEGHVPTYRSEISTRHFVPINSTIWYGISILLPSDFPIENNRLVVTQWWQKAKTKSGDGVSPPLAFRFVDGRFYITVQHSPDEVVQNPNKVPIEEIYSSRSFGLGRWHDFVVQAKWSYQSDGFVRVWLDSQLAADYHGPVGYVSDVGPTLRFGLYRNDTKSTYISYISQARWGNSFEEVDPLENRP